MRCEPVQYSRLQWALSKCWIVGHTQGLVLFVELQVPIHHDQFCSFVFSLTVILTSSHSILGVAPSMNRANRSL